MEYNITFTLGDPYGDGHANTSTYHMECSHSIEEIEHAYKKFVDEFGFDYVKNIGNIFEASRFLTKDETNILISIGAIKGELLQQIADECFYFDDVEIEYVDIFEGIIRHYIPDFKWEERDLKESELYLLRGAAYGFAYHGE